MAEEYISMFPKRFRPYKTRGTSCLKQCDMEVTYKYIKPIAG